MVAQIDIVDVVANLHDNLLNDLLPNHQFPEVNQMLQLLDNLFKTHQLEILIELDILNHKGETDCLARAQHQMFDKVQHFRGFFLGEELEVDEGNSGQLSLKVGWDVSLLEDVKDALLDEGFDVDEGEGRVDAVSVEVVLGTHSVVQRVHDGLDQLEDHLDGAQLTLRAGLLLLLFLFVLLPLYLQLIFELAKRGSLDPDLLFFLPKLLIDKFLEILKYLLHHDQALKHRPGFLLHEANDKQELTLDSIQLATPQFEIDDPVRNDLVEARLLPDLDTEGLVIPQFVAVFFKERQHAYGLNFIEVQQLVEESEVDGRRDQFIVAGQSLT